MKNTMRKQKTLLFSSLLMVGSLIGFAQNPIIQTAYTADPAPMVYNGKVYLYTTHDEDNSTWFTMNDWRLYTTDDMVNWTDHGTVLSYKDFKWSNGDAWASQCIERNGKFYMYVPVTASKNGRSAIGVAVSDSPYGPFYDPLDKPLVQSDWGDIDPSVFIDDDGQAYLYWGNPQLNYIKLNEDMISYTGDIVRVPLTAESFGKREGDTQRSTLYEEGPWLYKRDKKYYLFWPGGPLPEHIGYSMSDSPTGPWKHGGVVMPAGGNAFTIHPGVIDFKGKTYFFYHNGMLPKGGGFNRSVCVEEMKFNNDGSIPQLKMTEGITKPLSPLNPFMKNEAETIAFSEGFKSFENIEVGVFVTAMKDDSYIKVCDLDFRNSGATNFTARLGTTHNDPVTLEVRLDGKDGKLLGTIRVPRTGGNDRWALRNFSFDKVTGVHDLYFIVKGRPSTELMYFDYWMFSK